MSAADDPCAEAESLLDAMQAALRAGDLAALAPIGRDLAAFIRRVEAEPPAHPLAPRLGDHARRTLDLLESAGRGLAAARRRVAELAEATRGLSTYDATGRRHPVAATAPRLDQRG
jgi:hypothetical protein